MTRLEKANEKINKVLQVFKENKELFNYYDLKLHDLFMVTEDLDAFYEFCSDSYTLMLDELVSGDKEIYFADEVTYVGRTSKFYLGKWFTPDMNDKEWLLNIPFTLYDIIYDIAGTCDFCKFEKTADGYKMVIDDYTEDDVDFELRYIIDDIERYVDYRIDKMRTIHNYIKDFKEDQINLYKEWLEYYN